LPTGGLGPPGPTLSVVGSGIGCGVGGGREWRGAKLVSHAGEMGEGSGYMESREEAERSRPSYDASEEGGRLGLNPNWPRPLYPQHPMPPYWARPQRPAGWGVADHGLATAARRGHQAVGWSLVGMAPGRLWA
jgi:hypothetical protein